MNIIIDIDDTISNFCETLLTSLNQLYRTNYSKKDVTSWDWFNNHFENPWFPLNDKEFWKRVSIDPIAVETIQNLQLNYNQVYLTTASHFNDALGRKINETLSYFNPKIINERNVIVCQDKLAVRADIRIDDGIHNLSYTSTNILIDQPWNQDCKIPHFRFNDWSEINKFISNFSS